MALRRKFIVPAVQQYQQLVHLYSTERNDKEGTGRSKEHKVEATAYEVLGLPESCTKASIRATFRKLAKATHPDLQTDTSAAHFIRILAAYEILSDPTKRAEYDKHIKSRRAFQQTHINVSQTKATSGYTNGEPGGFSSSDVYEQEPPTDNAEVVSWLRSYRAMIKEMVSRREIGVGTGEEEFKGGVQTALERAYFGPSVSVDQGVPECFEAEERAQPHIQEVFHLVSGRQLFGEVRQIENPLLGTLQEAPFLLQPDALENHCGYSAPNLSSCGSVNTTDDALFRNMDKAEVQTPTAVEEKAYVDLELHLFGKVVARSIRVPSKCNDMPKTSLSDNSDADDCIYIFLSSEHTEDTSKFVNGTLGEDSTFSRVLLGTIHGLRSMAVGDACFAHGPDGKRSHLVLQHRMPLVKHMQWFRIGEESAPCECRCRRASTLPSRYWIFEPRSDTHNVGGWYIETFSQKRRLWKSRSERRGQPEVAGESGTMQDLLHPAMYIIAAAYKTLDEEVRSAQERERSLPNRIRKLINHPRISGFIHWLKHKWNPMHMGNAN